MSIRELANATKKSIKKSREEQRAKNEYEEKVIKPIAVNVMKEDVRKNTSSGTANWFGTGLWDKGNELYKLAVEKAERERIDNQVNSAESNARKRQAEERGITYEPEPIERDGFGNWFEKNIMGGVGQFNKSLMSGLDLVLPTEILGKYDFVSNLNDYYSDLSEKQIERANKSSESRGKGWNVAGELLQGTVSAVPNAVLAWMSAGVGGTSSIGKTATETIPAMIREMMKKPTYWSSFLQTAGLDYEEAKRNGASDAVAALSAVTTSLLNAGIEVGSGIEKLPETLRNGGKRAVWEWAKSALDEGKEEVAQSIISQSMAKLMYDKDKEIVSLTNPNAIINPVRLGKEYAMGVGVGGILGGVQTVATLGTNAIIDKVGNRYENKNGLNVKQEFEKTNNQNIKYSVSEIVGKNANYGIGVKLDTNIFDGVKPRNWNTTLTNFVYNKLAGKDIIVQTEDGSTETISFAKLNERVQKDGANNSHKVIDKLARTKGNINSLSVVHIDELLETSKKFDETQDHSHQWLDENGWEYRKTYIQDIKGNVYETTLNIAKAKDGRKILYALSNTRKVDDGVVSSTSYEEGLAHKHQLSDNSVPQAEPIVKREDNVEIKPDGKSSEIAVELIVDGWGENGKVSFNSSFDAEVNDNGFKGTKAEYMRNYNLFYVQGLNGGKISNVPSQYADRISMSARKAAYNAGVADRNASLDAKYRARNEAVVKDGGLIRNHNTENISAEMADVLERLGKMFGVTVEIQDKVIGDDGKEKNGLISNGEVKLSYDKMVKSGNVEKVAEFIINHEIAHRVQELAPKEYQKFRDIALEVAIEGDKAKYINEYAKKRNLTYDEAIDEIVCDMVGKESFATELALKQPNLAERIKNWIKDILDTLGLRKYNDFEKLLRTWENVCNQAQKQVEVNRKNPNQQKRNEVVRYSEEELNKIIDKSYSEQVSETLHNDISDGNQVRIMNSTPSILKQCGLNDLPMQITRGHLRDIYHDKVEGVDKYHGISEGLINKLPELIADPAIVFDSFSENNPDAVCILTKALDSDDLPIMVVIKPDGKGRYNNVTVESNVVLSMYGKDNPQSYLNEIAKHKDNILLINKIRTQELVNAARLQLPAGLNNLKSNYIIHKSKNLVKKNNLQKLEKYSEGDVDELFQVRQERDEAIKKAEYYKSQLKRTKPFTPNEKSIKSLVKKLAKDYDGGKNLGAEFRELYTLINRYMSYAREKTADPIIAAANWESVTDKVKDLGMEIVKNTIVQNDEASKKFDTIKKIIKGYNIRFPEEYRGDFDSAGGSMAFRRKNLNRINIRKEGTPVDVVYDELNQMFGDLFPDEITHPVDQLLYLDEFLDRTGVVFENPYNSDLDAAAEYMSSEIFEGLLSVDAAKPTVVDKMAEDADRRVEEIRQKKQKAIDRITEQHKKALLEIEGLKAERSKAWKERSRAKSEGQLDLQSRRELMRLMNKVKRMLKTSRAKIEIDSDKKLLLNELDLESVRLTGKKLENLEDLKKYYETMKSRANFVKDVGIEKKLEVLSKKHLAIMSTAEKTEYLRLKQRFESCEKLSEAELERLADLMEEADKELSMSDIRDLIQYFQYIEHQIRTADYMINSEDKRNVYIQGENVIEDIRNSGGIKKYGVGNFINHYLSGTLSPMRFVRRITGWRDSTLENAFQSLQKGEVKMQDYQMRVNRAFDKWVRNEKFMSRISGKDAEFEKFSVAQYDRQGAYIGTRDIEITRGMMISLYLHNMNYSNQRHMTYGGVTIPDKVLYQKGKIEEAYNSGAEVYLNPREIKKITNRLTREELNYANDVYDYFNEFSKKEINTVSAELYGYEKAGIENYFPIYTNKAFLQTDFEAIVYDGSLENIGFMKERQGRATPIMLDDVTNVLDRSIKLHSRFVGLAVPVRNMNRLMAVTTSKTIQTYKRNEYGQLIGVSGNIIDDIEFQEPKMEWGVKEGFTGSVMKEIEDKWGEPAKKYIENMMSDLQGGRPKNENGLTKAFNKLYGNVMSAQLMLKLHIAVNQAASYFVAAPDVGWKALMRALPDMGRVDLNLIARYTPLQWSRNNGDFDPTMSDIMKGKQGLVKKALNSKYLNFMAHSDALVTRKLWKAAEYNIRDKRKDLKIGTDEYYEAVAELYEKTILNSQPNSMTMERPEFLRSDSFTRFMFPFQGETMKNTNMVYDALGELNAKKKQLEQAKGTENEKKVKKAYEDAQKNAWRTVSSQLVSGIVFSVVVGAAKIGLGGEKERRKYEDEEGKIAIDSILKKMGTDFFENTFFQAPGAGEVYEIIKSLITKERYYGGGIMALDTLYDVAGEVINLSGGLQKVINGDTSVEQFIQTVRGAIHTTSIMFGIPSRAIENYATSIAGWVIEGTTDNKNIARYKREHLINVLTTKTTDEDGNATIKATSPVYDILYSAFSKGDKEAYNYIIYDLLKKGVNPENVESAINSRKNKDENFDYSQSLGMYAGISQSIDYEEYEKYIEDAEEVGIIENDLRDGIALINNGKSYKQMIKNVEDFVDSKNYSQSQKDFFLELAQKKYSIAELTNEQYLQYCSERDRISTELLNDMNFNVDNISANELYSKVLRYSEAVSLENASGGEYVIISEWINYAKKSRELLGISAGEFIEKYDEYGKTLYSKDAIKTVEKGYSIDSYLEFKKNISGIDAKNENGESVNGLKKKRIKAVVQKMKISQDEKDYLFSLVYPKG